MKMGEKDKKIKLYFKNPDDPQTLLKWLEYRVEYNGFVNYEDCLHNVRVDGYYETISEWVPSLEKLGIFEITLFKQHIGHFGVFKNKSSKSICEYGFLKNYFPGEDFPFEMTNQYGIGGTKWELFEPLFELPNNEWQQQKK